MGTISKASFLYITLKRTNLQTVISFALMLLGLSFTLGAALYGTSYVLASHTASNTRYLESIIKPTLGVYQAFDEPSLDAQSTAVEGVEVIEVVEQILTVEDQSNPVSTQDADKARQETEATMKASSSELAGPTASPTASPTATRYVAEVDPFELQPPPTETPTPTATPTETPTPTVTSTPLPTATPAPTQELPPEPVEPSQPIVRLNIPRLSVERAVVEIGVHPEKGWDTDALFATKNRPDLIGHLQGSALPGEGSNIVLAGHNYDWGIFQWNGVFYNLKQMRPGDKIAAFTQGGEKHIYVVEKVKEIPFTGGNDEELFKHAKHLGPTETERLTLITCSGANLLNWNKRVYVIAYPVE